MLATNSQHDNTRVPTQLLAKRSSAYPVETCHGLHAGCHPVVKPGNEWGTKQPAQLNEPMSCIMLGFPTWVDGCVHAGGWAGRWGAYCFKH